MLWFSKYTEPFIELVISSFQRTACQSGCVTGEYILGIAPFTPPFRPLAPPTLTPLTNLPEDAFRAGVYSVNLTSAMPRRGQETPPLYGFLFRIEDNLSGNVTYLWQVLRPRVPVDIFCVLAGLSYSKVVL